MAFGCFKPAVVLEGIRARFLERKGGAGAERACLPDARRLTDDVPGQYREKVTARR
jgi:hypothetical protein